MMSEGNGFATRDAFLGPAKRRFTDVEIETLGKVRIRSLTELERSKFEASMRAKNGEVSNVKLVDMKARLIVLCVVDGEGNPLLTHRDIDQLLQQDSKVTNELVDAIQAHCGFTKTDIEELEKNCGATATGS